MRIDSQLVFTPTAQSLIAAAGVDVPSTNTIDLLGLGVGVVNTSIIGNASVFGEDIGIGDGLLVPKVQCTIGTAATTGSAATLNVQFQLAIDDGTGNPGTWVTAVETGELAAASLTAGQIIARFDWPPTALMTQRPRFARLNYAVPAGTTFTAGTIGFAGVVPVRDDATNKNAASNFEVAG